ncbi:MAG: hypothetical protein LR015_11805 [Verrucomicrobia bacterium]|nr:hypothetical protein [Verrucomicrobiota bacterium]
MTVDVAVGGTAVRDVDYTVSGGTATFAAGSDTTTWTLTILDDDVPELDKTIIVSVVPSEAGAYVLGFPNTVTFTLRDDDVFTLASAPDLDNPFLLSLGVVNPGSTPLTFNLAQSDVFYSVDRSDSGRLELDNFALPTNASTVTFNWQAVNDDGISNPLQLGFDFPFGDQVYNTVRVHTNGFLTFEPLPNPSGTYRAPTDLPNAANTAPAALLAPFWTDLGLDGQSSVRFGRLDNSTFVVEYRNVPKFPVLFVTQRINFRVVLRANGTVYFQYNSSQFTGGMRAGFQNADRTIGQTLFTTANSITYPTTFRLTPVDWITPASNTLTVPAGETAFANWWVASWLLDYGDYEQTVTLVNPNSPVGEIEVTLNLNNRPFWMQAGWQADAEGWFFSDWAGILSEVARPWHYHLDFGWFVPYASTATTAMIWSAENGWISLNQDWAGFAYLHNTQSWHFMRR